MAQKEVTLLEFAIFAMSFFEKPSFFTNMYNMHIKWKQMKAKNIKTLFCYKIRNLLQFFGAKKKVQNFSLNWNEIFFQNSEFSNSYATLQSDTIHWF